MTNERFDQLLNGPLSHPMVVMFRMTRLALALFHVVERTGDAGEKALEQFCAERQCRDEAAVAVDDLGLDDSSGLHGVKVPRP